MGRIEDAYYGVLNAYYSEALGKIFTFSSVSISYDEYGVWVPSVSSDAYSWYL